MNWQERKRSETGRDDRKECEGKKKKRRERIIRNEGKRARERLDCLEQKGDEKKHDIGKKEK